ncbi:MAG: 3-deoxy-manno-octulosonate cytidylyltransferase [Candidatus Gracilibacteria bacterium]|nr:3-deoxy-manno-octulosonate cytidylyltransferase [Candidatus Gracilibacteria bacterium]
MNNKVLIVLPCRLGSTRLPEKHLIELSNGKTIFQMTYEACLKTKADKVIIATDDEKIISRAKKFTTDVVMTSTNHKTGSDRVAEVAKMYPEYDIVLNVQGDEPLVDTETINEIIYGIIDSSDETVMCTACTKFYELEEVRKPHNVKVVLDKNNMALYFSRSIIPFDRTANLEEFSLKLDDYNKHLGLYAYKRDFLLQYVNMPQTFAEKMESLEQLRILENGFKIKLVKTDFDSIGIDTKEDLEKLEIILKR